MKEERHHLPLASLVLLGVFALYGLCWFLVNVPIYFVEGTSEEVPFIVEAVWGHTKQLRSLPFGLTECLISVSEANPLLVVVVALLASSTVFCWVVWRNAHPKSPTEAYENRVLWPNVKRTNMFWSGFLVFTIVIFLGLVLVAYRPSSTTFNWEATSILITAALAITLYELRKLRPRVFKLSELEQEIAYQLDCHPEGLYSAELIERTRAEPRAVREAIANLAYRKEITTRLVKDWGWPLLDLLLKLTKKKEAERK